MNSVKRIGMGLALGVGLLFAGQTVAMAQSATDLKDSIHQYQNRADSLKKLDVTRYNSEMSTIAEWIEQSLILIGKDELKPVRSLVVKTGVYLDYVEANVAKDDAMGRARKAETNLKALKAEYGKLEADVQQLEAEEAVLTKQLDDMKKK